MRAPAGQVDDIFDEIIEFQNRYDVDDLRLFKSIVSADQYRRQYYKIAEYVAPGSKILDWGCGPGHFSLGLSRLGFKTTGFGFNDFQLRSQMPDDYRFTLGSMDDPVTIPYKDKTFDAVVSMGVLEHVQETGGNELDSMNELWRILRPGGHFCCFHLPNKFSIIEHLNQWFNRPHYHPYKFAKRQIKQLCDDSGFELIEVGRYGALPRNQWNAMSGRLRNSRTVARAYNRADVLLAYPLSLVCQNYRFVARKPDAI